MKKFNALSFNEQTTVIHTRSAELLMKFTSAFKEDWETIPDNIMDDLSALLHNRHRLGTDDLTLQGRGRILRRVSHNIYEYTKKELGKDLNTSFSEARYSSAFDVDGFCKTLSAMSPEVFKTRSVANA